MLIAKGTRDEGYFWTSQAKEKRMKDVLRGMKAEGAFGEGEAKTGDLDEFLGG